MKAEDLSARTILTLASMHVKRFETLIHNAKEGARGINQGDCEHYLVIWQALQRRALKALISQAGHVCMTEDERDELQDAIDSGDYDDVISSAEHGSMVGTA